MLTSAGRDARWLLSARVNATPNQTCLIWYPSTAPAQRFTYAEFGERVRALAAGLAHFGVQPQDRVWLHLDNCCEFLLLWHACLLLGAVAVSGNTQWTLDETKYGLDLTNPVAAVTHRRYISRFQSSTLRLKWIAVVDDPSERTHADDQRDILRFSQLSLNAAPMGSMERQPWPSESHANIQFTSGSSGRPKAVVWTHANVVLGAQLVANHFGLKADDVTLVYLPLYHANALMYSHLSTFWSGGTTVLLPRFRADVFWDAAVREQCTWTSMTDFAGHILRETVPPQTHSFRFWMANACDKPEYRDQFNIRTVGFWGMTETVSSGIVGEVLFSNRPMTIGRCALGGEIAVVDETGVPVQPNGVGELLVRRLPGVTMCAGYLAEDGSVDIPVDRSGWFHTGDLVKILADGYISFDRRKRDAIRVGGELVASAEIERVIAAVDGVVEVAVIGKPDAWLGEIPVAFIVARNCEDPRPAVLATCRNALARFKIPREVIILNCLPRTGAFKIAKQELRSLLASTTARPDS